MNKRVTDFVTKACCINSVPAKKATRKIRHINRAHKDLKVLIVQSL